MRGFLRDIALAIRLHVDRGQLIQTRAQLQAALQAGTAPAGAIANLARIEDRLGRLNNRIHALGAALALAFGGRMIFNWLEDSIRMFVKFDQKLQQSVAIMDNVSLGMRDKMATAARTLSKELNIASEEVVQGYFHLAQAGMTAEQSLAAIPIAALFAKAGMMSMQDATEKLTQAVSALGYESADPQKQLASMARVADVLAMAAAKSKANINEFASALNNKAAVSFNIFGKEVEEGVAALAMMADAGVKGAVAGERLDIFIRQVTSAAVKNKEEFAKMGIAIFDTNGKMRSFADISHDLTNALGGLSDRGLTLALSQLGIQQRTQAAVKMFIGAEDSLREYEEMTEKAAGTTKRFADKQLVSAAEQFGIMQKKIQDARMEIGEALVPALLNASGSLGNEDSPHSVIGQLRSFAAWIKQNEDGIGMLGRGLVWLATKPLMLVIDAFNIIADLIVGPINGVLGSIAGAFTFLGIVATMAAHGIGEFLDMIGLDKAGAKVEKFAEKLAKLTETMGKLTKDRFEVMGQNFTDLWNRATSNTLGIGAPPAPPRPPRLVDQPITGTSGRDNKKGGTGEDPATAETEDQKREREEKEEKARQRKLRAEIAYQNKVDALNNRFETLLAKRTADRVDDELQQVKKLEEDYKKVYGDRIPKNVKDGLEKIKLHMKEGDTLAALRHIENAYNKAYKNNIPADVKAGLAKIAAAVRDEQSALDGLRTIERAFKQVYNDEIPADVKAGLDIAYSNIKSGEPVTRASLKVIEDAFAATYGDRIPASAKAAIAALKGETVEMASAIERLLKLLEAAYQKTYGENIPSDVSEAFDRIRAGHQDGSMSAHEMLLEIRDAFAKVYGTAIPNDVRDGMDRVESLMRSGDPTMSTQAMLNRLERMYAKTYGDKIPAHIKAGLKEMKAQIKGEGAATATSDMFDDLFKGGIDDAERLPELQAFIDRVTDLKSKAKEGTKEWEIYNDVLEKAIQLMKDSATEFSKDENEDDKHDDEERARKQLEHLRKIERIAAHVADNMADGFGTAMEVLIKGSGRGIDAMEQLGRKTLAAMISPLAEFAMNKSRANFLHAAEEIAAGIAAASNPFTAHTAGGHFAAAAKYAAVGTAWAAFGGAVGAGASMIGNSNHGLGNASDTGRDRVDDSRQLPPEINIWVDGVDPKNPTHQKLIGETAVQYYERSPGGTPLGPNGLPNRLPGQTGRTAKRR
jgi:TP901 family phage tail tape measure protein